MKVSVISRIHDYWMERRSTILGYGKVTIGLVILLLFILLLHLSVGAS